MCHGHVVQNTRLSRARWLLFVVCLRKVKQSNLFSCDRTGVFTEGKTFPLRDSRAVQSRQLLLAIFPPN